MNIIIKKIKLINYKKFRDFTIEPNERINILVGDNEVGKSSILEAIDLVASGSIRRVETIGLDRLINVASIEEFQKNKCYDALPIMKIELYLEGVFDHTMKGKNNSLRVLHDGIRLVCSPDEDFITEINSFSSVSNSVFPYEYYKIRFSTFADEVYSSYRTRVKSVLINNANISSNYATTEFIQRMYYHYTESDIKERAKHINSYRQMKDSFCNESFKDLNARVPIEKNYRFGLENRQSKLFGQELMIYEEDIAIDNKGTGKQVLIKTDFALKKAGDDIDVILFEEPENHLSHVNLKKLVTLISESQKGQTFLSTHNSLISTRLELENLIVLSSSGCNQPLYLRSLPKDTSNYFLKAPPANIIEFVLSPKVILIEGPSEYILFDQFYKQVTKSNLNSDGIHVMDVRGLSFKRYLELAKISGSKIAVITDNDGNYNKTCVEKYKEFSSYNNIEIFFDENNNLRTFEKLVYNDNKTLCKNIFGESPENYMLANKTDSALELSKQENLVTPNYIKKAIDWIRE